MRDYPGERNLFLLKLRNGTSGAFEPNILPVETLRYRTTSGATHSLKWNIPCALMR